jgi:hypothetical protein
VSNEATDVEAESSRFDPWKHLLSIRSREAQNSPELGISHSDCCTPSFGGDGIMAMLVKPGPDGNPLGPDALATVLAQVLR